MPNILGLIPARGGSKGIPDKNIVDLNGRPLISYTIKAALSSHSLNDVIVSTDSQKIADIASSEGAKVPFLRPKEISSDTSSAVDVFQHSIDFYTNKGSVLDYIVYLQPTSPLRTASDIQQAIKIMLESDADSLVSVMDVPHQFGIDSLMYENNGKVVPVETSTSLRRQDKQSYLARNGPAILITKPSTIEQYNSLYGNNTAFYKMSNKHSIDIDNEDDLNYVRWLMQSK